MVNVIGAVQKNVQKNVVGPVRAKVEQVVPIDLLVRGAHVYNRARRVVDKRERSPKFVEKPIPDGADIALADIDMSNPFLYRQGQWESHFKRLRDESPVHFQKKGPFGPFWSVTRYEDILAMDKNHHVFSAEPYIVIGKMPAGFDIRMFIAMDPPQHDLQRNAVQGVVAPKNLKEMESLIRSRVRDVLDNLPVGEPFNWVDKVSIELTGRMLATLMDYPYEDRRELTIISDLASGVPAATGGTSDLDETFSMAVPLLKKFLRLWNEKKARFEAGEPLGFDLISLMLADPATRNLIDDKPMEFLGNAVLLIVGGNDTTRNSMSGGVYALNKWPEEFAKLKANPKLIPNMVSEIVRWQTPLAYMARRAKEDTEVGGQKIKKGEKLIMWYSSANRDERHFENPEKLIIDRPNARNHIAFGFGVHRCMGNRLAEMQLRILWEELLERFDDIKVLEEPEIVQSTFVRGYSKLMVTLTKKQPSEPEVDVVGAAAGQD